MPLESVFRTGVEGACIGGLIAIPNAVFTLPLGILPKAAQRSPLVATIEALAHVLIPPGLAFISASVTGGHAWKGTVVLAAFAGQMTAGVLLAVSDLNKDKIISMDAGVLVARAMFVGMAVGGVVEIIRKMHRREG